MPRFLSPLSSLAAAFAVFTPTALADDPRVNPAPTAAISKTVQTTCSWTKTGETQPQTADATVDVEATVPTTVAPGHMFEVSYLSTTFHLPENAGMFDAPGFDRAAITSSVLGIGSTSFDLTAGVPLTLGEPPRVPASGSIRGFAALASQITTTGRSIPVTYRGFTLAAYSRAPYGSWAISCLPTDDALLADVPVVPPAIIPTVDRVVGRGIAGFGGMVELRGSNLAKVKRIEIYGKRAPFIVLGDRLLVFAPALPAGLYPVTVFTATASTNAELRYTRLF